MHPFTLTDDLFKLWTTRFRELPLYCGEEMVVGIDEVRRWRDWTRRNTTPGEMRIQDYIETECRASDAIFHVGFGNSQLAKRFSPLVAAIVGITIQRKELRNAEKLGLSNYFPMRLNKYSAQFPNMLALKFDFIADANPSSFCCCFFHFCRMMHAYRELLNTDGQIVTDKVGLGWVVPGSNERWRFGFEDWTAFADAFKLVPVNVDGLVYTMRAP